jgi:hypothetical protein
LLKEFEDSEATLFVYGSLDPDINESIVWTGEVLKVDEATPANSSFCDFWGSKNYELEMSNYVGERWTLQ